MPKIQVTSHGLQNFVKRARPWRLLDRLGSAKPTLQNGLTGLNEATAAIRDDDAKGRHTTTARALRQTLAGGLANRHAWHSRIAAIGRL